MRPSRPLRPTLRFTTAPASSTTNIPDFVPDWVLRAESRNVSGDASATHEGVFAVAKPVP